MIKKIIGIVLVFVVLLLFVPALLYEPIERAPPTLSYNLTDAPSIPTYDPKEYEPKPSAYGIFGSGYNFTFSKYWIYSFEERGGLVKPYVENSGRSTLFIYEIGMRGDWMPEGEWYQKKVGFTVEPYEEQALGLFAFGGAPISGKHEVQFRLAILAKGRYGDWFNYGNVYLKPEIEDFKELGEKEVVKYKQGKYEDYEKINEVIDPTSPQVREIANEIVKDYRGEYNIYQVCTLLDWVKEETEYASDHGFGTYWKAPEETLKTREGTSEDRTLLLATMIEAIGGSTRIIFTEYNTYVSVYIGDKEHSKKVMEAIELYYGENLSFAYWQEEGDIWLIADGVGGYYLGDFPAEAELTPEGWTLTDNEVVYYVDIAPEHFK